MASTKQRNAAQPIVRRFLKALIGYADSRRFVTRGNRIRINP